MSLETALRFEADKPVNPNLKKAYEAQVERIKVRLPPSRQNLNALCL